MRKMPRWAITATGFLLVSGAIGTTVMRVEEEIADQRRADSIQAELRKLGQGPVVGYVETWGPTWKASTNRLRSDTLEDFARLHEENISVAKGSAQ